MNTPVGDNPDKNDKGFTLIEVLMALAIFSIGILAVASLQLSSVLQSRNSSDITNASAEASNKMEELMLRPFDHSELDSALNPHTLTSGKYNILWTVTLSDLNGDATNESKIVEMTVNWNKLVSGTSNQREVKFYFIKHQNT